jgi:predicted transcriptional regulator
MTEQQNKMVLFQLHVEQVEQLDRIAKTMRVSRSAIVRFAIDAYVASFFAPALATDSQADTAEATEAA